MIALLLALMIGSSVLSEGFLSAPVALAWVIALSIRSSRGGRILFIALVLGFIIDIVYGWRLGTHSGYFLIISYLLLVYERKFHRQNIWYMAVFSLISVIVYYKLFFGYFFWPKLVIIIPLFVSVFVFTWCIWPQDLSSVKVHSKH